MFVGTLPAGIIDLSLILEKNLFFVTGKYMFAELAIQSLLFLFLSPLIGLSMYRAYLLLKSPIAGDNSAFPLARFNMHDAIFAQWYLLSLIMANRIMTQEINDNYSHIATV